MRTGGAHTAAGADTDWEGELDRDVSVYAYERALLDRKVATVGGQGAAGLGFLVGQVSGTTGPDVRDRLAGYGRSRSDPVEQAWVMYRLLQPLLPADLRERLAGREDQWLVLGLVLWGGLPPGRPFTLTQLLLAYGPEYVHDSGLNALVELGLFRVGPTGSYTRIRPAEIAEPGLGRWEQTLPNPGRSRVSMLLETHGIRPADLADTLRRAAIVDKRYPFSHLTQEIHAAAGRREPSTAGAGMAGFLDRLSVVVRGIAYQATWSDEGLAVVVHRAGSPPRTDLHVAEWQTGALEVRARPGQAIEQFRRQRISVEPADTHAETVLALVEALPLLLGGDMDDTAVIELDPPSPASLTPQTVRHFWDRLVPAGQNRLVVVYRRSLTVEPVRNGLTGHQRCSPAIR